MKRYRIQGGFVVNDLGGRITAEEAVDYLRHQLVEITAERDALQAKAEARETKLAEAVAWGDEWHKTANGWRDIYNDIAAVLRVNVPAELVGVVARNRMEKLDALEKLVSELEHPTDPEDEGMLPKYARYAIEWFRKVYPK
jgi:hypothetical protein